jgi:hypothetical protein
VNLQRVEELFVRTLDAKDLQCPVVVVNSTVNPSLKTYDGVDVCG